MSEPDAAEDYSEFAAEIADQVESFLVALREIARGDDPGSTLSLLLLEVSQLVLAGGRLGAIVDVVPPGHIGRSPSWRSRWVAAHGVHPEYAGDDRSEPENR